MIMLASELPLSGPSRMTSSVKELPCPVAQYSLRSSRRARWPGPAAGPHSSRHVLTLTVPAARAALAVPGGDGGGIVSVSIQDWPL
jgi:hypothetical protein